MTTFSVLCSCKLSLRYALIRPMGMFPLRNVMISNRGRLIADADFLYKKFISSIACFLPIQPSLTRRRNRYRITVYCLPMSVWIYQARGIILSRYQEVLCSDILVNSLSPVTSNSPPAMADQTPTVNYPLFWQQWEAAITTPNSPNINVRRHWLHRRRNTAQQLIPFLCITRCITVGVSYPVVNSAEALVRPFTTRHKKPISIINRASLAQMHARVHLCSLLMYRWLWMCRPT